ncbi:hypothetical protein [Agromyces kandeliae]|uniref:Leucine-rich repeat domain-containing protein n=1 Tax=Agromyces kandeliae TaxID=2666141 RepID=A0A6L5R0Q8_9MICO|nr:hypothetical protein [Agromyces kandeliae]MRX43553.1 hypothetical protein [Agromyces kandeliae]
MPNAAAQPYADPLAQRHGLAALGPCVATASTTLVRLHLVSRVPQELLDSLAGQPQLQQVHVKWGPYRDVTALGRHDQLRALGLGGATSLVSLAPLTALENLTDLSVEAAHRLDDPTSLGAFTRLAALEFGNGHPGSDTSVTLPDLGWVRSLTRLRTLALPGIRLLDADLSPLLDLPELEHLRLPLRRQYRKQVFDLADSSDVFADIAAQYEALDSWRASLPNAR